MLLVSQASILKLNKVRKRMSFPTLLSQLISPEILFPLILPSGSKFGRRNSQASQYLPPYSLLFYEFLAIKQMK